MRVVYMGTPEFAVPPLSALIEAGHEIAGVYTQPDRPKGRGHRLVAPPVKDLALKAGLEVYQPEGFRDPTAVETLRALEPEVIVVAAYGRLLPQSVLDIPRYGCVNIHASLLPRLRGAAPIQWAILRGDTLTGVTTMQMAAGLDTGDILLSKSTAIDPQEDAAELYNRLSRMGADLILPTLEGLRAQSIQPVKQENELSTYAPMLDKSLSPIDWSRPAQALHNQVRGLQPWPVASTIWDGRTLKIHRSKICDGHAAPGEAMVRESRLFVGCGDGRLLELCEVQLEGSRRMSAGELLRGHPMAIGTVFETISKEDAQ